LGPNGAGKTTLIGSVARLVRAPTDHIFVFGYDAVAVFIAADVLSSLNVNHASQETCSDFDADAVLARYEQIGDLRSST
jgi:ABC-type multidrug transport system ATPase subunit